MGNKSHILDFSSKTKSSNSDREKRPLPVLVKQALDVCSQSLDKSLKNLFEQADDFLFDMSENGYNNAHFDAMRMLRMKKDSLIRDFAQELRNSFEDNLGKLADSGRDYTEDAQSMSFENIALVGDSELEEGIAIDGIVKKAHVTNVDALEKIRIRLDTIVTSQSITSENNPFEPAFICAAFKNASLELDVDIESLLVVYKLFERVVVSQLPETYEQVNGFFIDKGVLPDLKISSKQPQRQPDGQNAGIPSRDSREENTQDLHEIPNHESYSSNSMQQGQSDQVWNLMQGLLAQNRPGSGRPATRPTGTVSPIDTAQLVSALTHLQTSQVLPENSQDNIVSELRSALASQLQAPSDALEGGALGQFNDDMIDIVSMLFDFILDDDNVHSEIKSIIARLQIPMLKVGLVDRSFFANKKHPARILLNEIARAGISWSPDDIDAKKVLKKIEALSDEINTSFKDDISLFEVLLNDFHAFRQDIQRRANIFERRTREAEEGKAKAESARAYVNAELEKLCKGKSIPESVRQLLKRVWVHVMFLERLKAEKSGWDSAVKVAKLLIMSVQPVSSSEKMEKLRKYIPSLIKNLRKGFNIISLSPIDATRLLDQLEESHRELFVQCQEKLESQGQEAILRLRPTIFGDEQDLVEEPRRDIDDNSESVDETVIEEVEIQDIGFTPEQTGLNMSDKNHPVVELKAESLKAVERLNAGHWVELELEQKLVRCKLAAKISSSGKYIFVNRGGVKMAEFFTEALATEYQLGRLKLIDDEALFDRALESVISNLRAMKS